jgi:hypothetical protein
MAFVCRVNVTAFLVIGSTLWSRHIRTPHALITVDQSGGEDPCHG